MSICGHVAIVFVCAKYRIIRCSQMVLETVANTSITNLASENPTLKWDAVNLRDVIPKSEAPFAFVSV